MRLLILLFLLNSFFVIKSNAQISEQMELVANKYSNYHKIEKEFFYTHFNKAVYFSGEKVWFKVYVLDHVTRLPFLPTRILHTELFDGNGKLVDKKLLYVNEATAQGDFHLNDSLKPGTYTFRAYTNWSKNFGEDFYFIQPITVLGKTPVAIELKQDSITKPDVQFFPEGGSFVANVLNTVAFKVVNNDGFGVQTEGTLKLNGHPIQRITTNQFGMGRFKTVPKSGAVYTVDFPLIKKDSFTVNLPKPLEKGIVLTADAVSKDSVLVTVYANVGALSEVRGKEFYIMVHRQGNGHFFKGTFGVSNKFILPPSAFPEGVAHLTLFDHNNQPIADRAVFIPPSETSLMVDAKREEDTVVINFNTADASHPVSSNISVSILPAGTIADNFNNNIYSRYFLEGDIKGYIEDPAYYFKGDWQIKKFDMDNLMLVQGWRLYDWHKILNNPVDTPIYKFHHGFSIKGSIPFYKQANEKDSLTLSLFSPENNIFLTTKVEKDGSFEFANLYLRDSSKVMINSTDAKFKQLYKNIVTEVVGYSFDSSVIIQPKPLVKKFVLDEDLTLFEDAKMLEEVIVKTKVTEQKIFESNHLVSRDDKMYKVDAKAIQRHRNLTDLLRSQFGLNVQENLGDGGITIRTFSGPFSVNSPDLPPVLIIDGMAMSDFNMLRQLKVSDVEAIAVSKANTMLGSRGAGGSIVIKTRINNEDLKVNEENAIINLLVKGFNHPSDYFSPVYAVSYDHPLFVKYGTLRWEPRIITDASGKSFLKFYLPKTLNGFKIRAEGITVSGNLLFLEKEIQL